MNELKRKLSTYVKEFADSIFDECDDAEAKARFVNKSIIGKGLNALYNRMDLAFIEVQERNQKKKKGGFF